MSDHERLLDEGPHTAPEPETAEQRSKKLGLKSVGGGIAAGGLGLAKFGVLGKLFIWFFATRGVIDAWRIGGWIAAAAILAVIALVLVLRSRRTSG